MILFLEHPDDFFCMALIFISLLGDVETDFSLRQHKNLLFSTYLWDVFVGGVNQPDHFVGQLYLCLF
jgi:hypothetical protein